VPYKYFVETSEQHKYLPSIVSSVAGCTLTAALSFNGTPYVADPKSHAFVLSFDEATGELHIDADLFTGFQGSSVDLAAVITFEDVNSIATSGSTVDDNFEVTLTNPCTAAVPTWSGSSISDKALTIQNHPSETV
jgi:hypothetical protein